MFVKNYFYKKADLRLDDKSMIISDTLEYRNSFMSEIFLKLYGYVLDDLKPKGKVALLYCGGAMEHHSHNRIFSNCSKKANIVIKSQSSYLASKIANKIGNISYLSINANTCASSMYALFEAYNLLNFLGFDEVVIYGEEWVEGVELLLFSQFGIDIVCSDGYFVLHLSKDCKEKKAYIKNVSWIYENSKSPFEVTKNGYKEAMKKFINEDINLVKLHGTGTKQNNLAEYEAVKELFGKIDTLEYKSKIGHSQGVSSGVELCMLIDDFSNKNILVNASGLGNFYGTCLLVL